MPASVVVVPCPISDCEAMRVMELSGEIRTQAVTGMPEPDRASARSTRPKIPDITKAPAAPRSASRRLIDNTLNTPCYHLQAIVDRPSIYSTHYVVSNPFVARRCMLCDPFGHEFSSCSADSRSITDVRLNSRFSYWAENGRPKSCVISRKVPGVTA